MLRMKTEANVWGEGVPDMLALVVECCLRYISHLFRYIPHFYPTSLKLYDGIYFTLVSVLFYALPR